MTTCVQHPEWEKENSLTAPEDRALDEGGKVTWRPEQGAPNLTEPEVQSAMGTLNNTAYVDKFPRVDRTYSDPPVPMQTIGLISFTPARGATPNGRGIYGWAKLRGNYATEMEANQRAEYLIRNADSYHQIYHTHVGRPFPVTASPGFSAETEEVEVRREMATDISGHVKKQKDEEQKTAREIREREQAMIAESKKAREGAAADPYDLYITLSVKKAQLCWMFFEHLAKLEEIRGIIIDTRSELERLDKEHPNFQKEYFEKYMEARRSAGLEDDQSTPQDNFIKYMTKDVPIPTIDTDETLPQRPN